jgi:hypothetical protein
MKAVQKAGCNVLYIMLTMKHGRKTRPNHQHGKALQEFQNGDAAYGHPGFVALSRYGECPHCIRYSDAIHVEFMCKRKNPGSVSQRLNLAPLHVNVVQNQLLAAL